MADQASELEALDGMLSDANAEPTKLSYALIKSITNDFSREIGRGGFGVVYLGALPNGKVAVKKLSISQDFSDRIFRNEVQCLIRAKHNNIVRFLGYCADTQGELMEHNGRNVMAEVRQRLLCFEYAPNGSLYHFLKEKPRGDEWKIRYQMIKGICEGLNYLHKELINHLDLKPENVLLNAQMEPKITDFGLSRWFEEGQSRIITKSRPGTRGYTAPEIIDKGEITFKSDIFSLGIIVIKLLTRSDNDDTENWCESIGVEGPEVKGCIEIARNCVEADPHNRPSIGDIIHKLNEMDGIQELRNDQGSSIHQLLMKPPTAQQLQQLQQQMQMKSSTPQHLQQLQQQMQMKPPPPQHLQQLQQQMQMKPPPPQHLQQLQQQMQMKPPPPQHLQQLQQQMQMKPPPPPQHLQQLQQQMQMKPPPPQHLQQLQQQMQMKPPPPQHLQQLQQQMQMKPPPPHHLQQLQQQLQQFSEDDSGDYGSSEFDDDDDFDDDGNDNNNGGKKDAGGGKQHQGGGAGNGNGGGKNGGGGGQPNNVKGGGGGGAPGGGNHPGQGKKGGGAGCPAAGVGGPMSGMPPPPQRTMMRPNMMGGRAVEGMAAGGMPSAGFYQGGGGGMPFGAEMLQGAAAAAAAGNPVAHQQYMARIQQQMAIMQQQLQNQHKELLHHKNGGGGGQTNNVKGERALTSGPAGQNAMMNRPTRSAVGVQPMPAVCVSPVPFHQGRGGDTPSRRKVLQLQLAAAAENSISMVQQQYMALMQQQHMAFYLFLFLFLFLFTIIIIIVVIFTSKARR